VLRVADTCCFRKWSESQPVAESQDTMAFAPNADLTCTICDTLYPTANCVFSFDCATEHGCRGHLCWTCLQKSTLSGMSAEPRCPHCRREVRKYTYAYFARHCRFDTLQDRADRADKLQAELNQQKYLMIAVSSERDMLRERLSQWRAWSSATRSALMSMPSSSAHVSASARAERSRSPPPVHRFEGEYTG